MAFLDNFAAGLTGAAATAFVMAEMHWTSAWFDWQPTHLSAIAIGILSIAVSQLSEAAKNDQARRGSRSAA